ncbi:MAG TPA: carbohydrate porin [Syntrophales bacterium]|nr:carbohydrate porin [Syntrophales bacterium]
MRKLQSMRAYRLCFAVSFVSFIFASAIASHADSPAEYKNASHEPSEQAQTPVQQDSLSSKLPYWFPKLLGAQFNGVYQYMPDFNSPYQGQNSLSVDNGRGRAFTQAYGLYLGSQLTSAQMTSSLQAYLDAELFKGDGISDGVGLGGYVNGDVIRAGSLNLPKDPYIARAYLKYYYSLSSQTETVERAMGQLPGNVPVSRFEVKIGKISPTDDFDVNRYANNNRTQFLNYAFLYNVAWDYASDTRGYSYGFVTALVQQQWRLAFGIYMEPYAANGSDFIIDSRQLGYNLELDVKPFHAETVIRLLVYFNEGRMGDYNDAVELGRQTSTTPSLLNVEKPGGTKYGFGLNVEHPLADDGATGIFGRIGWNDGNHETWSYTEADRHVSAGFQLSGVHWGRSEDRLGIAYGVNGLSSPHKDYLEAGGLGILLGDGRLNYGLEQIFEVYYLIQLGRYVQITPDFQFIQNPGYNTDRGPVAVYGLRFRLSY